MFITVLLRSGKIVRAARGVYSLAERTAAETDDLVANGQAKLARKNADMIVANQVGDGKGFGTDTNEGLLITANAQVELPSMSKLKFAHAIFDAINSLES